jgi:hypothetical protein
MKEAKMPRAFVIRPFGKKKDSSGLEIDFETVHNDLIAPALNTTGFAGSTTGEIVESGNIREDMFALIIEADLIVCDITIHNANVFYELGIRHALRKKRTILIKGGPIKDSTPFDLLTDRYMAYDISNPGASKDKLTGAIEETLKSSRTTDSPVFQMLPSLPEADVANIQVVPLDFREDVNRARAGRSKGWLRLLADEVRTQRFQWEGLKLVGSAQWDLKDYEGARLSWETVREMYPSDIETNLALANIYERLYRDEKNPDFIELSEQALDRVLNNVLTSRKQRVEALALRGRNQKTRWRLEFEELNPEEKRSAAMNRALINSYEAYRNAFLEDLNHFYSGINALQMGTILLAFSKEDMWYGMFENDRQAKDYQVDLEEQVASLRAVVPGSIDAALRKMNTSDPERVWAEISRADIIFLTDDTRIQRVINAYRDAIPDYKPFAWDAARGQLTLFADLGIKTDLANAVITGNNKRFKETNETKETPSKKSVHVIIFAGHRVDGPTRSQPRFPEGRQTRAKSLIREALQRLLDDKHEVHLLASGAPGADILTHEICQELGLASTICLPMPKEDFGSFAFDALDSWRTRFLDLASNRKVLELSDRKGLPRWLRGSDVNPWERGNCWVMQMALSWGAARITLLALWDGKGKGDDFGGTAHMLDLARAKGRVRIEIIDAKQLLI